MTAPMVDDLTDSGSNKDRECIGPGVADILTGSLGGMAGWGQFGHFGAELHIGIRTPPSPPRNIC